MKQTEQANDERQVWIEHIFRAADDVESGYESSGKIDRVDRLK